ncbi:MAG: diaminopimelate decarboxylase [Parvibaculales bacterium]
MHHFTIENGRLFAEQVDVTALAEQIGTPFYCYSSATLERHYTVLAEAFSGLDMTICYSVKANSNLGVVATLAKLGAGADIVSQGELQRALMAGVPADKIVFSGVGKTAAEMDAALDAGIAQFNVESLSELELLSDCADQKGVTANVALRVNPDIDAGTHEKISTGKAENKFGIAWEDAAAAFDRARALPGLNACGIDIHIGSQITSLDPFERAFTKVAELHASLTDAGHDITRLDLGGGLGVPYDTTQEAPPAPEAYAAIIAKTVGGLGCRLFVEPGRLIAANAGILVTSVIRTKRGQAKNFVIVDAAMTELMRPTLYGAHHDIRPVTPRQGAVSNWDIVGPVCETGDFIGTDREMSEPEAGDLLVVYTVGAYGATLGSTYNTRRPAPEVLVSGGQHHIVRERPAFDDMLALESVPEHLK